MNLDIPGVGAAVPGGLESLGAEQIETQTGEGDFAGLGPSPLLGGRTKDDRMLVQRKSDDFHAVLVPALLLSRLSDRRP